MSSRKISYKKAVSHVHQLVDFGIYKNLMKEKLNELWKHWSAIVCYAHVNNQPEFIKQVETYYQEQQLKRREDHAALQAIRHTRSSAHAHSLVKIISTTPLHQIMKFAKKYYSGCGQQHYSYAEVVQIFIDAGASVQSLDDDGKSVLSVLMGEMKHMKSADINVSTNGNNVIIETVRSMLTASLKDKWANVNELDDVIVLYLVPKIGVKQPNISKMSSLSYFHSVTARSSLAVRIVHLIVLHMAANVPSVKMRALENSVLVEVMSQARVTAWLMMNNTSALRKVAMLHAQPDATNFDDTANSMMDILGEAFRCLLLHGINDNLLRGFDDHYQDHLWAWNFLAIAGYSCQADRSDKLIKLILKGLKASQVEELKATFLVDQTSLSQGPTTDLCNKFAIFSTREEIRTTFRSGLEWLGTVETPRRLEHLAHKSILHAMGQRCLIGAATLGLPSHMVSFVLLESD